MKIRSLKPEHHATHFLIGSFTVLLLVSIGAFVCLGRFMSKESEESIHTVGNLYMAGINNHITAHFRTLIDLKLEQAEGIVDTIPADISGTDELYEELVHRADVRNFNYVALYSTDGTIEMLDGSFLRLADPESFRESLAHHEKKVAVGYDSLGNEVVMFGLNAEYPMSNGEKSLALVVAVPIDYISAMLGTDEENALIFSSIIRKDGSFIISDMGSEYEDYFESLYARFPDGDPEKIGSYIQELSEAMEKKENYATVLDFDESNQQIYCTMLPYSEWHLITILPFGPLNETVEDLDRNRTLATLLVCSVIFAVLLIIFFIYYRTTCRQLKELEEARQEALAATKAKSSFLSNMSHDIRTPMNAIVGMTAIAVANIDNKQQVADCLKKISLSSRHLLGLINDVLDMSKIASGKMTLNMEQISLSEVIESIATIVQPQIKIKKQKFDIFVHNVVAENVYCDSVRLNQVLLNLLSNAYKFTPDGGTIELSLYQEASPLGDRFIRTHIEVQDNGIGMSEEFKSKIFESFTREDRARVNKTEGTGLGMSITKYIVDAMHGDIQVESEQGKGTKFHITVDLEIAVTDEVDMILPPWKMLVVDDDQMLCDTTVTSLGAIGVKAEATLDGETAIDMAVKAHDDGNDYDVILMDWKLPGIDGIETARRLHARLEKDIPILLISAYDWSEIENEAREAGISGFISKPLFKSTLFYGLHQFTDSVVASGEANAAPAKKEFNLEGKRILIAEDNDLNWEIAQALLTSVGLQVEHAENGQLCVDMLLASKPRTYDAILMDIRMPVMNGLEATKVIRGLKKGYREIPIIAMTADAFSEDVQKCLEAGMNAHISKPIDIEIVKATLAKFISANE